MPSPTAAPATPPTGELQRQAVLWRQFLPLSLTDVTMAFGDPLTTATLAHLPAAEANLAAVGIAKSLAVFFESPIIMVLHASNALAPSLAARRALWRFVVLAMAVLSGLLLVLTLPPVFRFFGEGLLGIPAALLPASRSVLLLMVLWPAAIAWRRYFQGQLIHAGQTTPVGRAGVGRLLLVATILGTGYAAGWPGEWLAGVALMGGVLGEAAMVTAAARRQGSRIPSAAAASPPLPADLAGVWRFYWPLANSMLVVWGGRALLVGLIARAVDGTVALAAWPAAWGLVLLIANATRMVQQVIIRNRQAVPTGSLVRFALGVGLVFSLVLAVVAFSPPGQLLLVSFVGPHPMLQAAIWPVIVWCLPVPLLVALQNAAQGFIIGEGRTRRINLAAWLGTGMLLGCASTCLALGWPGATAASAAMLVALATETAWLGLGIWSPLPRPDRRRRLFGGHEGDC